MLILWEESPLKLLVSLKNPLVNSLKELLVKSWKKLRAEGSGRNDYTSTTGSTYDPTPMLRIVKDAIQQVLEQ